MDFSNRSVQSPSAAPAAQSNAGGTRRGKSDKGLWGRVAVVAAVAAIAIILLGVIGAVAWGGPKSESSYVDSSKLQAVFLNTGQVYFGNIKSLNKQYVVLTNIYYLQTANSGAKTSNSNVTLVKLGCELHEPFDKMVINRDQVTFWENLQDGGQVAKAVATFKQQNPNGQKCTDQSSSAATNSVNNAQNAGNASTNNSTNTTNSNSSTTGQ